MICGDTNIFQISNLIITTTFLNMGKYAKYTRRHVSSSWETEAQFQGKYTKKIKYKV